MESHGAHELHRNLAWLHEIERHLPMIQWWMRQEVKRLERECPAVLIDLEPPVVSQ
jgi:hypothetical protein